MTAERRREMLHRAEAFARCLDRENYDEALTFLARDCAYETGRELIIGAKKIIASYADNARRAKASLDAVRFESLVDIASESSVRVLYMDHVTHRGQSHIYRCRQILTFNDALQIDAIVHEAIPAEEALKRAFLEKIGVDLGQSSEE